MGSDKIHNGGDIIMYKGNCKVVVIPTGEACDFDYDIMLVDGEVQYFIADSIKWAVCKYIAELVNKQLKNKEIKYKMLKSQLLLNISILLDVKNAGVKCDVVKADKIDIAYQRLLGGRLL